jgi:hypothetical protein
MIANSLVVQKGSLLRILTIENSLNLMDEEKDQTFNNDNKMSKGSSNNKISAIQNLNLNGDYNPNNDDNNNNDNSNSNNNNNNGNNNDNKMSKGSLFTSNNKLNSNHQTDNNNNDQKRKSIDIIDTSLYETMNISNSTKNLIAGDPHPLRIPNTNPNSPTTNPIPNTNPNSNPNPKSYVDNATDDSLSLLHAAINDINLNSFPVFIPPNIVPLNASYNSNHSSYLNRSIHSSHPSSNNSLEPNSNLITNSNSTPEKPLKAFFLVSFCNIS